MLGPESNQAIEFSKREQLVKSPVIIDGFSRSGKFLLGQLVATLDNIEYIQNPFVFETILYLTRLKN